MQWVNITELAGDMPHESMYIRVHWGHACQPSHAHKHGHIPCICILDMFYIITGKNNILSYKSLVIVFIFMKHAHVHAHEYMWMCMHACALCTCHAVRETCTLMYCHNFIFSWVYRGKLNCLSFKSKPCPVRGSNRRVLSPTPWPRPLPFLS